MYVARPSDFRAVERDVGVAQQILGALVARVRDRDADAGGGVEAAAFDVGRLGDGGVEPLDPRFDVLVEEDDPELVAAEARDHLARPHDRTQPLRHGAQQRVAGQVPEAVVDDLEVIEVDERDGQARQPRAQRVAERCREEAAVRQARSAHRGSLRGSAGRGSRCGR